MCIRDSTIVAYRSLDGSSSNRVEQPAVSESTWQDPSDAPAEEGPDRFVFYNVKDNGLDPSGDPGEATIQPEVGETGGGRDGGGSGGGGRSGGGRSGGGSGGGGSGGGGSG
eukprot:7031081-Pyramimonas_sp.AAC.1